MTDPSLLTEITAVRAHAECLYTRAELEEACERMAEAITARLAGTNPLLLVVMTGGVVPAAMLLARLEFPLQVDYIHLTRYGNLTVGGELEWIKRPPKNVAGRTVLLVDDLLDHGLTLQSAVAECTALGAREVLTCALAIKRMANRAGLATVDFHAVETPDRYLFGYGMDYKTYWRNGGGLFAVAET